MPTLFIIATPIGNLADVSQRQLETLRSLDVLYCEDTRVTAKLLARYEVAVPLESYRAEVHVRVMPRILSMLEADKRIGYVSDAGTPGISDPGFMLVRDAVAALPDLAVVPIPGPSAVAAALSASGFPADAFTFLGFPPHKKGRAAFFAELMAEPRTCVFYESPHRIRGALEALAALDKDRQVVVFRELTKLHESSYRGTAAEALAKLPAHEKGEYVVAVNRAPKHPKSHL